VDWPVECSEADDVMSGWQENVSITEAHYVDSVEVRNQLIESHG
jgi:hypothetical protein